MSITWISTTYICVNVSDHKTPHEDLCFEQDKALINGFRCCLIMISWRADIHTLHILQLEYLQSNVSPTWRFLTASPGASRNDPRLRVEETIDIESREEKLRQCRATCLHRRRLSFLQFLRNNADENKLIWPGDRSGQVPVKTAYISLGKRRGELFPLTLQVPTRLRR